MNSQASQTNSLHEPAEPGNTHEVRTSGETSGAAQEVLTPEMLQVYAPEMRPLVSKYGRELFGLAVTVGNCNEALQAFAQVAHNLRHLRPAVQALAANIQMMANTICVARGYTQGQVLDTLNEIARTHALAKPHANKKIIVPS